MNWQDYFTKEPWDVYWEYFSECMRSGMYFEHYVQYASGYEREWMAVHAYHPQLLAALAEWRELGVGMNLVNNPHVGNDLLEVLADHSYESVRRAAARKLGIPEEE